MRALFFRCAVGLLVASVASVAGCGPYAPSADPPAPAPAAPAPSSDSPGSPPASTPDPPAGSADPSATSAKLEIVLTGRPIQAFAISDSHVLTLETDVRTRLVATEKASPHAVKVVLEEDVIDNVHFEGVGAARGRVFVVDSYGAMKSLKADGTNVIDEAVPGSPTRILSASQTLWLAELPRFLGDVLTFSWYGAKTAPAPASSTRLVPMGGVGDVAVDDEALVYATTGSSKTVRHWAPAASGPRAGDRLLATLPEEARGVGIDATHAFVHLAAAKEIRAIDRTTGSSTTVLAAAAFDTPPLLRSDGKNLYMLTETALRRCAIATCSSTMTALTGGLQYARGLVLDWTHAWIVMTTKGKTGVVARVPK